jgi:hypothetical protein
MGNRDKIPSIISYSPAGPGLEQQWGASMSEDAVAMINTKLALDIQAVSEELDLVIQTLDGMCNLHFQPIKAAKGLPGYTWKGAEEILTDFLRHVFSYLFRTVNKFCDELRSRIPVDIVVTVPRVYCSIYPYRLLLITDRTGHTILSTHCTELSLMPDSTEKNFSNSRMSSSLQN